MDITLGVTIREDYIGDGHNLSEDEIRAFAEEALIHKLVADNEFVISALILRPVIIGPSRLHDSGIGYIPDETTRQSR